MRNQGRTVKILASLVASMTVGAVVLMALDRQSLPAGAFSLASYTRLNSVEEVVSDVRAVEAMNWDGVEVHYSRTGSGNLEQLAVLKGLASSKDLNFHFVVCNGAGNADGVIQSTERWLKQRPALQGGNWYGNPGTIRICLIADGAGVAPTDSQRKRIATLVESLVRKFNLRPQLIRYPVNW